MAMFPLPPGGFDDEFGVGVFKLVAVSVSCEQNFATIMPCTSEGKEQRWRFIFLSQIVTVLPGDYIAYLRDETKKWWASIYRGGTCMYSIDYTTGEVTLKC